MLSCSCPDYDDDVSYWYTPPEDYSVLDTKRSRKCKSCGARIAVGDLTAKFIRWREASSDIEIKILGEGYEVYLADWYLCEACADQFFNLTELGFCMSPEDNLPEALADYVQLTTERRNAARPAAD
jgi:hypothetical protein